MDSTEFVDDILQDAYLRMAGTSASKIQNERAFLFKVVANLVIDRQRSITRQARLITVDYEALPEIADPDATPEEQIFATEQLDRLQAAVRDLPPRCREVFILRKFENLSQAEIAQRLGISRNMVEKHLRVGLKKCRDQLFGKSD